MEVVLPKFDPSMYVSSLAQHRPSLLHLVPPLVSFLASSNLVTRDHLASVRQIYTGL